MNHTPHRHARKTSLSVAPRLVGSDRHAAAVDPARTTMRARLALLAIILSAVALFSAPTAQGATGGAGVSMPVSSESDETTTTPAFDESELSFTPFRWAGASWYGGHSMWGRSTACGQTLRPSTIGVANKRLPCGTPVKFVWHGHSIVAPVIDRGPYIRGRAWDLTSAAAEALDFEGVGRIRYAIATERGSKALSHRKPGRRGHL